MRENRTISLSIKEIARCETLKMADEKRLTQREGAKLSSKVNLDTKMAKNKVVLDT
jgi:hypothetical protein